jgi:hypothetical protein
VFTVMLIVIVLYWLMVIIGAIGVDVLNVGEAAGGKIEGMVGGAVEGKIEGVVGGAVEGKIEGAVEGAVEAKVEGAADGIGGEGGGFLAMLGFGKVPATVVISSLVLWSWAVCLSLASAGVDMGVNPWVIGAVAPFVAVFLSRGADRADRAVARAVPRAPRAAAPTRPGRQGVHDHHRAGRLVVRPGAH